MPNYQINLPPKPEPVKAVWGSTDDVMTMIGFKRTKLNALRKEDMTFPKPIILSQNNIRWNLDEVAEKKEPTARHCILHIYISVIVWG